MTKYQDKWGRFHHKPCINGEPSSNNGWIYTAYYDKAINGMWSMGQLGECFNLCRIDSETLVRNPGDTIDKNVPISRDEILGMIALGVLKPRLLSWNFSPFQLPAFSLIKLVKQLWELRPYGIINVSLDDNKKQYRLLFHHRNYFWQNNLDQLYRFAFSVPVQDRHFILKCWDKFQWYNPVHVFYACVAKIDSLLPKKSGIKWLKYAKTVTWHSKREQELIQAMCNEFPEDHPIRQRLGL